jgi:carbamoylphosphate synthase large subunit
VGVVQQLVQPRPGGAVACRSGGREKRPAPVVVHVRIDPPEAVDAAPSKVRTRELSARLGLPTPAAQRVRSLDELFAAAAEVGFPAVVKPEFGASAMGCLRVDGFDALPGCTSSSAPS